MSLYIKDLQNITDRYNLKSTHKSNVPYLVLNKTKYLNNDTGCRKAASRILYGKQMKTECYKDFSLKS